MGWGTKAVLFVIALGAAAFGAWIITIPIFAILLLPPLLNKKKGGQKGRGHDAGGPGRGRGWPPGKLMGVVLLLLSAVAFFSGGVFSPIALAVAGFALLFKPRLSLGVSARVRSVGDSVLLRGTLLPFQWSMMAEAKVSTRDPEGALSGMQERLLFVSTPTPRIFLVFSTNSFSRSKAEAGLLRRMQSAARALGPLGVYLLPLGSVEAVAMSRIHAGRLEMPDQNLRQFLSTADYGAVAVEARSGFVARFEIYGRPGQGQETTSSLSELGGKAAGSIMLRELLTDAFRRIGVPQPDRYVTFLSSMAATEGETFGQRIIEAAQGPNEQALLVSSLSGPHVELSRAQLRAIARIYE